MDPLALTLPERLNRARADLRLGLPVIVDAPGAPQLAAAAEVVDAPRLAALLALGPAVLALTARRARALHLGPYDGDLVRLVLPETADLRLVRALADPSADLANPLKGPFTPARDGAADAHRTAIALVKSAGLLPAALVVAPTGPLPADLTRIPLLDPVTALAADPAPSMNLVVSARVPLAVSSAGRLSVFRSELSGEEHYAVQIGRPDPAQPVLVRLHSACFTGDLLGSLKCDCGAQLQAALAAMGQAGAGVLLYLNQEGRGIGLTNKMRAYALQDQGFDTVEANHRLGFEDDERDFRIGAVILRRMGITRVRLMTNNPAKVSMLAALGIEVAERVPLAVGRTAENSAYLATKARRSGHIL